MIVTFLHRGSWLANWGWWVPACQESLMIEITGVEAWLSVCHGACAGWQDHACKSM